MNEYRYLLKQKNKALGVFHKTRNRLLELLLQSAAERERCLNKIEAAQTVIVNEQDKIDYLRAEEANVETTIYNISKVLGD